MNQFSQLGLSNNIVRAVTEKGYETPSPIQAKAIPAVLSGKDMIAAAQTGTGKTAGFTLPMMQILEQKRTKGQPYKKLPIRSLILTPTRELAAQVQDNIQTYGRHLHLKSLVVFGGVKIGPQIRKLQSGVDILVATPGRLLDLCNQGACDLSHIKILVLDEADRMLDMGFINDIRKVIKLLPKKRQNLLFSATFSKEIRNMTRELLVNPVCIEVAPENTTAETITQRAYRCDATRKTELITKLIKEGNWEQILIFTRTKHGANRLSKKLTQSNIISSAIHGNKGQGARTKALEQFKKRKIQVLVATDIAARGLDIAQLPHVINFELPNVSEDYVHRIGRTGRAGKDGEAISLVSNEERPFFSSIEKLIKRKIPLTDIEGFTPQDWPSRAPTTAEVMRLKEERKKIARQGRVAAGKQSPTKKKTNNRRKPTPATSAKGENKPRPPRQRKKKHQGSRNKNR